MCSVFNGRGARRPRRYRRSGFMARGGLLAAACLLLAACAEGGGLGFGYKTDGMSEEEFLKISVRWITCLWSRYNHEEAPRTPVTELMPPEMYFLDAFAKPELMKERQQAYYDIFEKTCHEYGYDTAAYNTIFRAHKVGYYYAADENHVVPILRRVDRRGLLNRLGDAAARLFLTAGADCDDDGAWEKLFAENIPPEPAPGAAPKVTVLRPVQKKYVLKFVDVHSVDCRHDRPFPACDAIAASIIAQTPDGHLTVELRNNKRIWIALNDLDAGNNVGVARRAFTDEYGDFLLGPKEARTLDIDLNLQQLRSPDGRFSFISRASFHESNHRMELGPISEYDVKVWNLLNAVCIPVGGWNRDCMELLSMGVSVLATADLAAEVASNPVASGLLNEAIATVLKRAGMNSGGARVAKVRSALVKLGESKTFGRVITGLNALDLCATLSSDLNGESDDLLDIPKSVGLALSIGSEFYLLLSKSDKALARSALARLGARMTVEKATRISEVANVLMLAVSIVEGIQQDYDALTTPDPLCLEFTGTIAYE